MMQPGRTMVPIPNVHPDLDVGIYRVVKREPMGEDGPSFAPVVLVVLEPDKWLYYSPSITKVIRRGGEVAVEVVLRLMEAEGVDPESHLLVIDLPTGTGFEGSREGK